MVPVYNQIGELPGVLAAIAEAALPGVSFLLVNNGSTDGSAELVRGSGHAFLDLPRNRGVGGAMMAALDWALAGGRGGSGGSGSDDGGGGGGELAIFGMMAANGKMLPAEIPRLVEPILAGVADYVTGSRYLPGGASPHLPAFRKHAIPLVNVWVRLWTGAWLTDATCGFRAFRLEVIRRATFDWHAEWLASYGLEYYLYAKVLRDRRDPRAALNHRWRWLECPVTMRYPAAGRYSKIRPGSDWWAMLRPWLRARWDGGGFR